MKAEAEGKPEDLKVRTKRFALSVIRMYCDLPKCTEAQVMGKQVLRSGTSVGAHYREALRARSSAEYVSKIEGGMQELEETMYWIELLADSELISEETAAAIWNESDELMAIFTTIAWKQKERR
jgi:four helix bundle protein